MSLYIILLAAVRIPYVQKKMVRAAAAYLSDELNTEVSILSFRFEPFDRIVIRGLYIADQDNDTLLYARVMKFSLAQINTEKRRLNINTVELADAVVRMVKNEGDRSMNFDFILDYFSSEKPDTAKAVSWKVTADRFSLVNIRFVFRDLNYNDPSTGIDFEDLEVNRLFATFRNINLDNDSLTFGLRSLSFSEKSGFTLFDLSSPRVELLPGSLSLKGLHLKSSHTELKGDVAFGFESGQAFNDFIREINILADFDSSALGTSDIAYFAPELKGMNLSVRFAGQIKGTVENLRLRNFYIGYGNHTEFRGRANLTGLPDFEETFIDLLVDELKTSSSDLNSIPLPPFDSLNHLNLPAEIQRLGSFRFKGKFTGFYNDFVAYGNIQTSLGYLTTDLNLKFKDIPVYSGKLTTSGFQLDKFLNSANLGILSMNTEIKGKYFDLNRLTATITGKIDQFEFRNYPYSEIGISADLSKKLFNGSLNINDPNVRLDFSGKIDFTRSVPKFDFTADLPHADLTALQLVKSDSAAAIRLHADIDISAKNLDDISGTINLSNLVYSSGNKSASVNQIRISSVAENNIQSLSVRSELLSADVSGNFTNTSVFASFLNMLQLHFPVSVVSTAPVNNNQDFNCSLVIHNVQPLLDIFIPGLSVSQGTNLSGRFSSISNELSAVLRSDLISYHRSVFRNVSISGKTADGQFKYVIKAPDVTFRDSLTFKNLELSGISSFERATVHLRAAGRDSLRDRMDIRTEIEFQQSAGTMLRFISSSFVVDGRQWQISEDNRIQIESRRATLTKLNLHSDNDQLGFSGIIGPEESDMVRIFFVNFPLMPLNKILATLGFSAGGVANGEMNVRSLLNKPMINADLLIAEFSLFGDTLGNARFMVDYDMEKKIIKAESDVFRQEIKNLNLKGEYHIASDRLDFSVTLNKLNAAPFGHYLNSFASQVRGYVSGNLALTGSTVKPVLQGKLKLQKAAMTIDYINCRYTFADEVTVTPNAFLFSDLTLTDSTGNTALLNGSITHRYFRDFALYLAIRTKNVMVLNTHAKHNQLFYGNAFASGQLTISGPFELISFNGNLRTQSGTEISIPLSNPEEITRSTFIQFISPDTSSQKTNENPKTNLSGINMHLDVDITEDALVRLIYDEKIGDKLEGRGIGNIVFEITTDEIFTMRGDYTTSSGSYVFTLQNVINKRFYIQSGGTIRWNGSPYEAIINIDALYQTRASLYDLLADTTASGRRRIPVNINLYLRNQLLKPDISFSIDIPDIDPATQGLVRQAISTEDSKNKQTLSLLVLNRFLPGDNRGTDLEPSSSGFSANASEWLSVQITNWVSQLTDKVDVGINYRAGDKLNSDQLEVMLATRLFNDRVSVETNVGFNSNNNLPAGKTNSNIVGDFTIDVKLTEDGKYHFKAFNRANNINFLTNFNSLYTQGIGFYFKHEFNSLKDIFSKGKVQ